MAHICGCHGEPQRWNTDKRYTGGGYWRCAVKDRAQSVRYVRDRRDRDPLWRIMRDLQNARLQRRARHRISRDAVAVNPKLRAFLVTVKTKGAEDDR